MPSEFSGFYYPQTVFQDDWIKLAALYWDRIARIKWRNGPVGDSDTVRQLAEGMEFIVDLRPSSDEVAVVSGSFLATVRKHSGVVREHYKQAYSQLSLENRIEIAFGDSHLISHAFMTSELAEFIHNRGLGTWAFYMGGWRHPKKLPFSIDDDGNIDPPGIDFDDLEGGGDATLRLWPELYLLYMRSLAEKMASDNQMHLVTARVFDYVASSGYSIERIMQAELHAQDLLPHLIDSRPTIDELEFQMATIALRSVLPRNISEVSPKQIITLRNRYRSEMTAFQEEIYGFAADLEKLQDIPDIHALRAHLEVEYEKRIKPQLDDLQKCLKSVGIETVMGALNIRVAAPPLLASTLLTGAGTLLHLGPLNPLVIGTGAIAFSLFPVIQKKQQETSKLARSSPAAAYLLHIREALEPAKAATQVVQRARQIFYRQ